MFGGHGISVVSPKEDRVVYSVRSEVPTQATSADISAFAASFHIVHIESSLHMQSGLGETPL